MNSPTSTPRDWQALRLLNLYRMILAGLFVTLDNTQVLSHPIAGSMPDLFTVTALLYLLASVAFSFMVRARDLTFDSQVRLHVITDIIALTLMGHAAGDVTRGYGILVMIPVIFAGFYQPGRMAQFYASLAIIGLLVSTVLNAWTTGESYTYIEVGALAAALFATSLLTGLFARRLATSEVTAAQRELDLANLTELNAHIVQRLAEGILVADAHDRIVLNNRATVRLLGTTQHRLHGLSVAQLCPRLAAVLNAWRRGEQFPARIPKPDSNEQLNLRLASLGRDRAHGVLIFLEDSAEMHNSLQKEKLAALGRLTASIAHEIRNPLGAISHSAQLLQESEQLPPADQRLSGIIHQQTQRINTLIKDIITLSRRKNPQTVELDLQSWLPIFTDDYRHSAPGQEIRLHLHEPLNVHVDPDHLGQLLTTLLDNAGKHAAGTENPLRITIEARIMDEPRLPCIDIIDNGPGIAAEVVDKIYEPFFTTHSSGSGLGLFLARELCEANHCDLSYIPVPGGGSCFRIRFPLDRVQGEGHD